MPAILGPVARLLMVLLPAATCAQTAVQNGFPVMANITAGCLVNYQPTAPGTHLGTIGALNFGSHSSQSKAVASASLAVSGTTSLRCTPGLTLTMRIDAGLHAHDGLRHMQSATHKARLAYQLFSDTNHSHPLAIDEPHHMGILDDSPVSLPIHARLTLPGNLPPGSYMDTLTVILEW